ncbi:hypothetical protein HK405_007452 [Cladochytrium tenue]|nr:hypothetical protein HK405_007452 [Cladochytrium tenue]
MSFRTARRSPLTILLLVFGSILAFAARTLATDFKFYVTVLNLPTDNEYLNPGSLANGIYFKWSWTTCAGVESPWNENATTSLGCVDGNGNVLTVNTADVFQSVEKFALRQNFPGADTYNEYPLATGTISTSLIANGETAEATRLNIAGPLLVLNESTTFGSNGSVTLGNLASDYYSFVISATDTLGRTVSGASSYFIIKASGDLPSLSAVTLETPLKGSLWLANSEVLVRWIVSPSMSYYPSQFNLTILDGETREPLSPSTVGKNPFIVNSPNFYVESGLGFDCNATAWTIPANLTNGRYRLMWSGGYGSQVTTSSVPTAVSDIFTIGPVKSSSSS